MLAAPLVEPLFQVFADLSMLRVLAEIKLLVRVGLEVEELFACDPRISALTSTADTA